MQVDLFDHLKDPCTTIVLPKSNSWHLNGQCAKNLRTIYWVQNLLFLLTTNKQSRDISSSLKKHPAANVSIPLAYFKDGVLHHLYIHNDVEYHQLVLPQRYHKKILQSLHNDLGHQGIDRTLDLLMERVYWPTMTQDVSSWVEQCRRCQVAKADYNIPKPKFGHLIAHNPLDLVCLDFTKIDPSKGR